MRVIGIDPGLRRTGWGVVDVEGARLSHVANGVCVSEGDDLATRLCSLHVPHDYVPSERLRLEMYKRLAEVRSDDDVDLLNEEMLSLIHI